MIILMLFIFLFIGFFIALVLRTEIGKEFTRETSKLIHLLVLNAPRWLRVFIIRLTHWLLFFTFASLTVIFPVVVLAAFDKNLLIWWRESWWRLAIIPIQFLAAAWMTERVKALCKVLQISNGPQRK